MGNNNLRVIIVGYGIQGKKRHKCANNIFAIVDPIAPEANFKTLEEGWIEGSSHLSCSYY